MDILKIFLGGLQESISIFLYVLSGLIGYLFPMDYVKRGEERKLPIVFVHGWFTQNPLYFFLKRYLESNGFSVYMTNFGLQLGNFESYSQKLKEYIENKNLIDVILVGVSGGSLISLEYLQNFDGWKYVKKFISMGGPFKGSPLAYLALFSPAARQMLPGSDFIKQFTGHRMLHPERIMCVSAWFDELVPRSSSELRGARNEVVDVIGHVNLQAFSKETYKLIEDFAQE